jgi:hypothetical protein
MASQFSLEVSMLTSLDVAAMLDMYDTFHDFGECVCIDTYAVMLT